LIWQLFFWDLRQSEKFLRLSYLYDKTMGILMKNWFFWENLWSHHNLPLISLMDLNICLVLRWPWLLSRIKLKFQKMKTVAFIAKKLAKNISKRTVNIVHNWPLTFFQTSNTLRFNNSWKIQKELFIKCFPYLLLSLKQSIFSTTLPRP